MVHPHILYGLVCAAAPDQVVPRAIDRLNLPPSCARVRLPRALKSGDHIAFWHDQGKCGLKHVKPLLDGHRLLCGVGIDLNRAGLEALTLLPGIGEVRARAIVDYRLRHGSFSSPGELEAVRGIGRKTVDRVRPWLTNGCGPVDFNSPLSAVALDD